MLDVRFDALGSEFGYCYDTALETGGPRLVMVCILFILLNDVGGIGTMLLWVDLMKHLDSFLANSVSTTEKRSAPSLQSTVNALT